MVVPYKWREKSRFKLPYKEYNFTCWFGLFALSSWTCIYKHTELVELDLWLWKIQTIKLTSLLDMGWICFQGELQRTSNCIDYTVSVSRYQTDTKRKRSLNPEKLRVFFSPFLFYINLWCWFLFNFLFLTFSSCYDTGVKTLNRYLIDR